MDKYKDYEISFSGLKNGRHEFEFSIHEAFFDLFEAEREFSNANLVSNIFVEKHSTFLDFEVSVSGTIDLVCDISNEYFSYPAKYKINFLVEFGEEYDNSNEEVIIIPHHRDQFNIAQVIYEAVMLSIPMKKISPKLSERNEYQTLLEQYSPRVGEEGIDPRWVALKDLKK